MHTREHQTRLKSGRGYAARVSPFRAPRGLTVCCEMHSLDPAAQGGRQQLEPTRRRPSMKLVAFGAQERTSQNKCGRSPFSGPHGDLRFGNKITVNTQQRVLRTLNKHLHVLTKQNNPFRASLQHNWRGVKRFVCQAQIKR